MNREPKWIEVNPDELELEQDRKIRGVTVRLRLSPYDVPLQVSGQTEGSEGHFFIRFKYITEDEKTTQVPQDPHLSLHVGKNTGRIYAIEIDVKALQAQRVNLEVVQQIERAIDEMTQRQDQRRGNYVVAKDVIRSREQEIFEPLVTAH